MIITYRYRVKNHLGELNRQARVVNYIWNYCNEMQKLTVHFGRKSLTWFDLNYLVPGVSKELRISPGTVYAVCRQYSQSRSKNKRPFLRWRGRKNLKWVPCDDIKIGSNDSFSFLRFNFKVFMSRKLPKGVKILNGSCFSQDSKLNWFLNLVVEIPNLPPVKTANQIGIDLGLKDIIALSDGRKIENPRHLSQLSHKLSKSQQSRKKKLTRNIHAKIKNSRNDFRHKLSSQIVKEFDLIAVGNVKSSSFTKTKMAKSVYDVGWFSFRNMLRYKAIRRGAVYEEVNESYSTQTCSSCGSLPPERPKGIASLGIRAWTCSICGVSHDRDVNAAINILLGSGHRTLAEGVSRRDSVKERDFVEIVNTSKSY